MQQRFLDGFLQGLLDPRFQGLLSEFYATRSVLTIQPNGKLLGHLQTLLRTVSTVLADQYGLQAMQSATGSPSTALLPDVDVPELLSCVDGLHDLVSGPAFSDTATVLFLFCGKLDLKGNELTPETDAKDTLVRLDGFLKVLGLQEVSIVQLWENATGQFVEQRALIWTAILDVLCSIQVECSIGAV
jgi:hypothetical protein